MANEKNLLPPWKPGQSGNPKGRRKGRKNLATIIAELEDEEFDWRQLPIKDKEKMEELISDFGPVGSPFRVMIYRALMDSIFGKGLEKVAAREFLRKAGYGDKLDVTSKGRKIQTPAVISIIKARDAQTPDQDQTTDGD